MSWLASARLLHPPPARHPRTLAVALLVALLTASSAAADSSTLTGNVRVVGVDVVLTLSATVVRVGDKLKAQAKVANTGPARLAALTVELRLPATGLAVSGSTVARIVRLQPGQIATTSWTICAAQAGNYLLLARVTVDGAVVESAAHLLSVSGEARRRRC